MKSNTNEIVGRFAVVYWGIKSSSRPADFGEKRHWKPHWWKLAFASTVLSGSCRWSDHFEGLPSDLGILSKSSGREGI